MSQYKRKYDGPPVRELKRVDQDPIKVAPHKKPVKYVLTVEYETVVREVVTKEFTSKANMQAFRLRVEAVIAKRKLKQERNTTRWYSPWSDSNQLKMEGKEYREYRGEPRLTETFVDGVAATSSAVQEKT